MKNFIQKMASRQITPIFAWIKLGTLLVVPNLIYAYGWWMFLIIVINLLLLFIFFPAKWIKEDHNGFMYHAMRGLVAETHGNVSFVTPLFQRLFDKQWKKILYWIVFVIYMFLTLSLFAAKHLIIGSLFFYPSFLCVFRLLVEYRDVSLQNSGDVLDALTDVEEEFYE